VKADSTTKRCFS